MNKLIPFIIVSFFISCKKQDTQSTAINQSPVALGQQIFEKKGNCASCHLVDQKVIGPSIQEISKIYKTQNANLINFLIHDAKPIIDPSQYEVMKTNFAITKALTNNELKAIEAYIYSN